MSLFSAIQGSANSLRVNQLGLQVVGNNIANVNSPGYIRQELVQAPAAGYRSGELIFGQGVQSIGIQQKIDELVLGRMRETQSQLSYQEQVESSNGDIESLLNELTDNDLSSKFSSLASAFQDIANQPGSEPMRTIAIQRGQELANQLRSISNGVAESANRSRTEIGLAVDQVNRLSNIIAKLNQRIVEIEGGTNSSAVGLRDERIAALDELSTFVDISVTEQLNGSVTVFVGGDYIVADGIPREVVTKRIDDSEGGAGIELRFVDTDSRLVVQGGKVRGLYDSIQLNAQSGFSGKIDGLARDIIHVVNRIHSQGQGSKGFTNLTGETVISKANVPFEVSNPEFNIDNGSFVIRLTDSRTKLTTTHDISIQQQGSLNDTTAEQIAQRLDAISGISAAITNDGRLQITSDSSAVSFSFAEDSSGVLAALGINTFFVGNSAASIGVRSGITEDSSQLAVSSDGVGNGARNALKIAEAFNEPTDLLGGRSLSGIYGSIVSETTRDINTQKGVLDGLRNFLQSLEAKHLGISGVNLDEEAVKMLLYQRAFQATSKLVTVVSDMLDTLVNIV
ncbi:MAG: flagellar hook-associated protein FlgK [Pirellula sp.]|jgi:flagellar hook-associated protein 1 FlgK|nr:flagellar hook-associated protein FlgK [Pirellula sp.]